MTVRCHILLAFAFLFATLSHAAAQQESAAPPALPKKFAALLEKAAEAEKEGQPRLVLKALQPIFKRASPEMLKLADSRLKQTYNLRQTVAELLVASRAQLVLDGQSKRLPRPGKKELPLVLVDLADRAAKLQTPLEEELAVGFPALVPDPVIEQKLKDLAPLLSTAKQADALLAYLEQLTKRLRKADRAKLMGKAKEIAARDFAEEHKKLGTLRDALVERLVDFTLIRLNKAVDVLQDDNASFQDRFAATERAADSLGTLHAHWEGYERSRSRSPQGLDPGVETGWQEKEAQFQQLAGPLLEKVYHYSEGTRWWLRGRYGFGHVGGGLAKAIPGKLPSGSRGKNAALEFLRDYPLLIPKQIEKPTDPYTDPAGIPIARRHLEWWQFESRVTADRWGIQRALDSQLVRHWFSDMALRQWWANRGMSPEFIGVVGETAPEDMRLGRLVGYLEYLMALRHFDRLLAISSSSERQMLEEMAAEDDRFAVYSNLSRKYDRLDPATTLRITSRSNHPRAKGAFEQRGLSWMIALARVEVGAMRAGHTGESSSGTRRMYNAERFGKKDLLVDRNGPFSKLPPSDFDMESFLEILMDGARQHYYEIRTEYALTPDQLIMVSRLKEKDGRRIFMPHYTKEFALRLLQLERKLTLAVEMVEAIRRYASDRLTPVQQNELKGWLIALEQQHGLIRGVLESPDSVMARDVAKQNQVNQAQKAADAAQKANNPFQKNPK